MKLTEKMIAALEAKGANRWTKGAYDRLYIDAELLGLEIGFYKSRRVSWARLNGEEISNRLGMDLYCAKIFVDIETGELHCDAKELEAAARAFVDAAIAEATETEETTEEAAAKETTETTTVEDDTMKTLTYTGITGKTASVTYDTDWLVRDGHSEADLERDAFTAFGTGKTDEEIDRDYTGNGRMYTTIVKYIVRALREVGGIWIGWDMALIEGKGTVIANSDADPELCRLWRAKVAAEEIVDF